MHLQLRLRRSHRRQRGYRRQLALLQGQSRTRINFAETEFDDIASQVWRDVGQAVDDLFAGDIVHFLQALQTFFVCALLHVMLPMIMCRRGLSAVLPGWRRWRFFRATWPGCLATPKDRLPALWHAVPVMPCV